MSTTFLPISAHPLIGREKEIDQLLKQLTDPSSRLITLTGPGGVGKTRLAVEVARRYGESANCEVRFVSLASLSDPDLVAPTIGQAFALMNVDAGVLPESLSVAIGERRVLLVVDNFEHLISAALLCATVLQSCSTLKVLVTSRVPLGLSLETSVPVPPLPVLSDPDDDREIARSPAIRLFLERSGTAWNQLGETDRNAAMTICRRADGLPLAIELAAAKTRLLSFPELLLRMNPALPLLTGGHRDLPERLQTMHNAIAWSYDLLSSEAQSAFCALSVFSGGFTIEAASAVAGTENELDTLFMLQTLLDHSLIAREPTADGDQRFTMLETIREFGQQVLAADGREHDIRDRHLCWFARSIPAQPIEGAIGIFFHKFLFPGDQDNLRSALRWSLAEGDGAASATLALRLVPFWWQQGLFTEARDALRQVSDSCELLPLHVRSSVFGAAAEFAFPQSDFAATAELATVALVSARELNDHGRVRWHLRQIAWSRMAIDPASAIQPAEEIVEISAQEDDFVGVAFAFATLTMSRVFMDQMADAIESQRLTEATIQSLGAADSRNKAEVLQMRGHLAYYSSDYASARPLLTEALAYNRQQGNRVEEFNVLRDLGRVFLATADREAAVDHFSQALDLAFLIGSEHGKSYCYEEAAAAGTIDAISAQLLGAAATIRKRLQLHSIPTERSLRETTSERLIASMGTSQYEEAFAIGTGLSGGQAYQAARRSLESGTARKHTSQHDSVLSKRETEVLRLIAEGKSDREIGEQLFVSHRTAATHVSSILRKLSLHSRAEAAAWAVRNDVA